MNLSVWDKVNEENFKRMRSIHELAGMQILPSALFDLLSEHKNQARTALQPLCNDFRELITVNQFFVELIGFDSSIAAIRQAEKNIESQGVNGRALNLDVADIESNLELFYGSSVFILTLGSLMWILDHERFFRSIAKCVPLNEYGDLYIWDFGGSLIAEDTPDSPTTDSAVHLGSEIRPYAHRSIAADPTINLTNPEPVIGPYEYRCYRSSSVASQLLKLGFEVLKYERYSYIFGEAWDDSFRREGQKFFRGSDQEELSFLIHARMYRQG